MSRIKFSSVQLGSSFILGDNSNAEEAKSNEIKEAEIVKDLIQKAEDEAAKIIADAQIKAQQLIQDAQDTVLLAQKQAEEEGHKEGFENGYGKGYSQFQTDSENSINSLKELTDKAFSLKREIIMSSEREILELTVTIAEKILNEQLKIKPELILGIIKGAIAELKDKEEVNILVNPVFAGYLYNYSDELKQSLKGLKSIKIIEDKTIPENSALVETPETRIDARLETQIEQITKELLNEMNNYPILAEMTDDELEIVIKNDEIEE